MKKNFLSGLLVTGFFPLRQPAAGATRKKLPQASVGRTRPRCIELVL